MCLHQLVLVLPNCFRFNFCSLIASTSAAASWLCQLLLLECFMSAGNSRPPNFHFRYTRTCTIWMTTDFIRYWLHISLCTPWYHYKGMCGHNVWTFWDMTRELLHAIGSYYLTKLNCTFVQLLVLIPFYTLGSDPLDRELVYTNDSSLFSFQIHEPLQAGVGTSAQTFYDHSRKTLNLR